MALCKVHNVRFYQPKPKAIYCMSYQKQLKKLAISRSDASIEIWNLQATPFIEKSIVLSVKNSSVEGLAWYHNRLFSVGLHGLLIEHDLLKLSVCNKLYLTGEAAFCLDINEKKSQICVGTELGYLNIFEISDNDVLFQKFLDKQEGRIICVKFDSSGDYIVSGGLDAIRVWNVKTGHALHKMTTGRSEEKLVTIIWSLVVTNDLVIISGDSQGKITFFDGKIGAQIEQFQSHRADILSVVLSDDEKTLYCSGIDPNILSYAHIKVKGDYYKWVKSVQRKVHEHDIRALALVGHKLYSGGTDGYLGCSYHPPKMSLKYPPILPSTSVFLADQVRLVLLKYSRHVEVWSLGEGVDENDRFSSFLKMEKKPIKLLSISRDAKNDLGDEKKEGIVCCAISRNGEWIVYSTDSIIRILHFKYEIGGEVEITELKELPEECELCVSATFTPNSKQLILATRTRALQIIGLNPCLSIQTIELNSYLEDAVTFLKCSSCGQYLLAADTLSNIAIWTQSKQTWKFYCKLPKYSYPITALNIHSNTKNVAVVYSDHKFLEFNLNEKKTTGFSNELGEGKYKFFNKFFPIRNITFDTRNDSIIIFHDDAAIYIVNKNKKLPTNSVKIPKIESLTSTDRRDEMFAVNTIKKYKHLVHLEWLENDEMIAVEINPLSLLQKVPPGFEQNLFGTK